MDKTDSKRLRRVQSWADDARRLLSGATCEDGTSQVVSALDLILESFAHEIPRVLRNPDNHRDIARELLSVIRQVTTHLHLRSTSLQAARDFPYWDYTSALLSYLLDLKLCARHKSPTLELCFHTARCKHRVWDVIAQSAAIASDALADRMPAVVDKLVAWCPKTFSDPAQFYRFLTAVAVVMKRCDADDRESLRRVALAVEPNFDFPAWFSAQQFDLDVPASKLKSRRKLINYLCKSAVTGAELLATCKSAAMQRLSRVAAEGDESDEMFAIAARTDSAPTVDASVEIELALEKTLTRMKVSPGGNADTTDCMVDSEIISDSSNTAVDPETFLQTFLNPEYGQSSDGRDRKRVWKRRRSEPSPLKKSRGSEMPPESEEEGSGNAASPPRSLRLRKSPTKSPSGRNHRISPSDEGHSRERRSSRDSNVGERASSSPGKTCRLSLSPENSETTTRLQRRNKLRTESPSGDARCVLPLLLEQADVCDKDELLPTSAKPRKPREQKVEQQPATTSRCPEKSPTKSLPAESSAALLVEEDSETCDTFAIAGKTEVVPTSIRSRGTRKRSLSVEELEQMPVLKAQLAHDSPQRKSPTKVSFVGSCLASSLGKDKSNETSSKSPRSQGSDFLRLEELSPTTSDNKLEEPTNRKGKPARKQSENASPSKCCPSQVRGAPITDERAEKLDLSSDAEVTGKRMGTSRRRSRNPTELMTSDDEVEDLTVQNKRKRRSSTMSSCSTTCVVSSSDEGKQQVSQEIPQNRKVRGASFKRPFKPGKQAMSEDRSEGTTTRKRPVKPASNRTCDTSSDDDSQTQDVEEIRDDGKKLTISPSKKAHMPGDKVERKTAPQPLQQAEDSHQENSSAEPCATLDDCSLEGSKQQTSGHGSSSDDEWDGGVISIESDSDDSTNVANAETESIPSSDELQHSNQASSAPKKTKSSRKSVSRGTETTDSESSDAHVALPECLDVTTDDLDMSKNCTADPQSDEQPNSGKPLSFKNVFPGKDERNKDTSMASGASKARTQAAFPSAQRATRPNTCNGVVSAQSTEAGMLSESVDNVVVPDSQDCASPSRDASAQSSASGEKLTDVSSSDVVIPETQDLGTAPGKTTHLTGTTEEGQSLHASEDEGMLPSQESNCLDGLTQKPSFVEGDSSDQTSGDEDMVTERRQKPSTPAILRTLVREKSQSPQLRPRSSRQSAIKARIKLIRSPEKEHEGSPEKQLSRPKRIVTSDDDSDTDPDFNLGKKKTPFGFKARTPKLGLSCAEESQQPTVTTDGDEAEGSQALRKLSKLSLSQRRSSQSCREETTDPAPDTTNPKRRIASLCAALKKRLNGVGTLMPPQTTEQQTTKVMPLSVPKCAVVGANTEGSKSDSADNFDLPASGKASHPEAASRLSETSVCKTPPRAAMAPKSVETVVRGSEKDATAKAAAKRRTDHDGRVSGSQLSPTRLASISQATTQPVEAGKSSLGFQSQLSEVQFNVEAIIDSLGLDNDEDLLQMPGLSGSLGRSCCYCSGSKETRTSEVGTMTEDGPVWSGGKQSRSDSMRLSESQTSTSRRRKRKRRSVFSQTKPETPTRTATERKAVTSHYNLRTFLSVPRRLKY